MYVIDSAMKTAFINRLATNPNYYFALALPNLSIKHFVDIKFAAVKLYKAGVPFDNQGVTRQRRMTEEKDVEATLTPFVEKIWKYFNEPANTQNDQSNFDNFHETLCDLFLTSFAEAGYHHTYGSAQKITNMLFKYLSCYKDYERFADLFSYCHIPIDAQILISFATVYNVPNTQPGKYNNVCWTQMDKETYLALCQDYRDALSTIKGNHSWLGSEYYIWAGLDIPDTGTNARRKRKFHA